MGMTIDKDCISANALPFTLDYCLLLLQNPSSNQALPLYTASPEIFPINELETRRDKKMILSSSRQGIDFLTYAAIARFIWVLSPAVRFADGGLNYCSGELMHLP
ncbi:hypothetical protein [Xenorhabdus szentirmaii]|uniref:Uncharacterized protein n=1 Tax=Xenorhabdus szentirmaii DSM 16338 TaxID=1427518 RepID=W1J461_9GAMM|nr:MULTISPECIES: hypothetical protein [Xenorhabdus]PHM35490.1 hypothetical protein Xsze_01961 [Xenorhabdus szentirmaii DSM 16338]PHM44307.1 hypothetical protein Xszus_04137 [Xenorhabdus szentirmaii]CDL84641.1 conserved hypothetical protein [Xenorhabdus szentirmaii DSM 16338]